jgi:hypothetical protein
MNTTDEIARLRAIQKTTSEPSFTEFTSAAGRKGYKLFSPAMGRRFEIHICENSEDVQASNEGRF